MQIVLVPFSLLLEKQSAFFQSTWCPEISGFCGIRSGIARTQVQINNRKKDFMLYMTREKLNEATAYEDSIVHDTIEATQ
jgi:hypothetical protein